MVYIFVFPILILFSVILLRTFTNAWAESIAEKEKGKGTHYAAGFMAGFLWTACVLTLVILWREL